MPSFAAKHFTYTKNIYTIHSYKIKFYMAHNFDSRRHKQARQNYLRACLFSKIYVRLPISRILGITLVAKRLPVKTTFVAVAIIAF